jgi:dTDP-4-dehydrorhamnose reductase
MKVTILGASGMLGSMVTDYLSRFFEVKATVRDWSLIKEIPNVEWYLLDAANPHKELRAAIRDSSWIINCIGIIRQKLTDKKEASLVNQLFPYRLAYAALESGSKVIAIATDCAFDGDKGNYTEADFKTPTDTYSLTKSLGEVTSEAVYNLRCSIVGPARDKFGLLEWFLSQPKGATVNGFTNHQWNGITTLHFAKLCRGIIENNPQLPYLQHIVPATYVSKFGLLNYCWYHFQRNDITIKQTEAAESKDMRLATANPELNNKLWQLAGYQSPPSIINMIGELSAYVKSPDRVGNQARDNQAVPSHT